MLLPKNTIEVVEKCKNFTNKSFVIRKKQVISAFYFFSGCSTKNGNQEGEGRVELNNRSKISYDLCVDCPGLKCRQKRMVCK